MHVGQGVFFQNLGQDTSDAEVYAHELAMAEAVEPLGFDSVWSAEHHFGGYHMCPNVAQFLTWMAGRTRKIQLGSMVTVLPWHNPLRVAEELSVLDHMSRGRTILGLGRGLGRVEFEGLQLPMAESRQRFTEYSDALLTALETGVMGYAGEVYRQTPVDVRPAPFASFKGRVYASAVSPESARIMARLGVGLLLIAQKPWETTVAEIENYRELYREMNDAEPPKPLLVSYVATHESEAAAQEMFDRYVVGYCRSALDHYEFDNETLADVPGYEYYGRLAARIAKHGRDDFVGFLAGLQARGTPAQVTEQLIENVRRIDGAGVIAVLSYGGMPPAAAQANQRLFAEQVLPALHGFDTGAAVGSAGALAGAG